MATDPKKVFQAFSKEPLRPDQMATLYIPFDELRGNNNTVNRLAATISTSNEATTQILCGHRGSGKSTELMKLKAELETNKSKYFVVYCESDEDIDRNDVDFPEVLIAVVRQLTTQLKDREKIDLKPGYFKTQIESLLKLFGTPVELEKFDINASFLKLSGTIKNSPTARAEVRKHMEPDTNNFLVAANELISEATVSLEQKGYAGLVILFDDLDKMVVRPMAEGRHSTDEHLFVNRSPQMTGFRCHMVYTMPLSLAYSRHHQSLKNFYSDRLPVVPMIKIRTAPPNSKPHQPGYEAMRKMVNARLGSIDLKLNAVFKSQAVCDELIELSGGQPSELMGLIRDSLIADGLPIKDTSLQRVRREGQRDFRRQLRREHWALIEQYRADGQYVVESGQESLFSDLLESRTLLQYVNDSEWYGLNPFVEMLMPPAGLTPHVNTP